LDDGYRDNLDHGLPVFRDFRAPFAVFPSTGFINRIKIPNCYLLEALCLQSDRVSLRHPERGKIEYLRSKNESPLMFFRRVEQCGWPEAELEVALRAACETASLSWRQIADEMFLSWDQARLLAKDPLVTFGNHTVNHPSLASLSESAATAEIVDAGEEMKRQLGLPIEHIAYPYGSPSACGPREFRLAEKIGLKTGLTTKRGNLQRIHRNSLYSLPRHTLSMAPHSMSTRYLRISLNGIWDTPINGTFVTR
jgi:hypothetical protein